MLEPTSHRYGENGDDDDDNERLIMMVLQTRNYLFKNLLKRE